MASGKDLTISIPASQIRFWVELHGDEGEILYEGSIRGSDVDEFVREVFLAANDIVEYGPRRNGTVWIGRKTSYPVMFSVSGTGLLAAYNRLMYLASRYKEERTTGASQIPWKKEPVKYEIENSIAAGSSVVEYSNGRMTSRDTRQMVPQEKIEYSIERGTKSNASSS